MAINESQKSNYWQLALTAFAKITGWVAAPIIAALFLGRFLDNKFQTKPWIFLGLTAVAFIVSTVGIVRESNAYLKEIDEKVKK